MITLENKVLVDLHDYKRLVGICISAYMHTEKTVYGGNHLAEQGLREFLQHLGEWEDHFKELKDKV